VDTFFDDQLKPRDLESPSSEKYKES